jgi:ATP-dependent RNA helicase RhlE
LNFEEFGLTSDLMEGLLAMNYKTPTPIQQQVIPEILSGHDVIGCAQTGTGKTAAFLLPLIHRINDMPNDKVKAMIIVPTRELAVQISQQAEGLGYFCNVSSLAIYGGGDGIVFSNEKRSLQNGVDIIICTPGRMISHLNLGYVDLSGLQMLILDEADRMLDMGFFDDIMKIISYLPKERQSLMFSATMPARIREMARRILKSPREINISIARPPEAIKQFAFVTYDRMKIPLIKEIVRDPSLKSVIIFCDTKSMVKQLSRDLKSSKLRVEEIHSDLEQKEREEVLNRFKSRQTTLLVATNIVSRGIDIDNIDMVINFDVPGDAEDYVHRVGRTARAANQGRACTLIGEKEQWKFSLIEKMLGMEIAKESLPESLDKGPEYNPVYSRSFNSYGGRRSSSQKTSTGKNGGRRWKQGQKKA